MIQIPRVFGVTRLHLWAQENPLRWLPQFDREECARFGGFLSHRRTPSHHPFLGGIFPNKNQSF